MQFSQERVQMLMVKFLSGSIFHWSYACPDSYESRVRDQVKEKDGGVRLHVDLERDQVWFRGMAVDE